MKDSYFYQFGCLSQALNFASAVDNDPNILGVSEPPVRGENDIWGKPVIRVKVFTTMVESVDNLYIQSGE